MVKRFPPEGLEYKYLQTNRSDMLGSLWSTFNLDFQSNLGAMRVSPRLRIVTSASDDADLGLPVAFRYFGTRYWSICGSRVFKSSADNASPNTTFAEDASSGAQTDFDVGSDLELFNGKLYASTTDLLIRKSTVAGAWTSVNALVTGGYHGMTYLKKYNKLYVVYSDAGVIGSVDDLDAFISTGEYTIDLALTDSSITAIESSSDQIWIGTSSGVGAGATSQGRRAKVYLWDALSSQVTNSYELSGDVCMGILVDQNSGDVYAMDSDGILSIFTGYGFKEIGRLPCGDIKLINSNAGTTTKFMHPNGIISTKNGTVQIVISNRNVDTSGTRQENLPSGIWEWSKENGFTHKYSPTYNTVANSTITDFGQNRISDTAGAIYDANIAHTSDTRLGNILVGFKYFTDATSTSFAIFVNDTLDTIQKKGYFVTNWITSDQVIDYWQKLFAIHRRFLNSTDKIVLKYRTEEESALDINLTWVNTNSFTTTTDISSYAKGATGFGADYGGEIEIVQGTGGGSTAHITTVVNNAGTYTCTIDTVITGVTTGTAKARLQKWIKLPEEITNQVLNHGEMPIGFDSYRIQIKGCMTFTGKNEFYKFLLINDTKIGINS